MSAPACAEWDDALNAAAMQLLLGPGDDAERLRGVQATLSGIPCDETRPAWARDALNSAVAICGEALRGAITSGSALQRVAVLVELVMLGEEPAELPDTVQATSSSPMMPADAARELFPEFVEESRDYLAQAEAALLELEANAGAAEPLNVVFRAFHSIKSSAAFLGLEPLSALAHDAESLLCPVRDGKVPFGKAYADLMLETADLMRALLEQARSSMEDGRFITLPAAYSPLRQRIGELGRAQQGDGICAPSAASTARAPAAASAVAAAAADDSWTRVRTARLDQLVDLMGELVVAQSMVAQDESVARERHGPLAKKVQHTTKLVRELQELALGLRMVPLRGTFQRLHRLVRDLAAQSGKAVELVGDGEETEIDRSMVEALTDPLVHMIRNAVDHGVESAAERAARGKPAVATLRLRARSAGGAVLVELEDDGAGLDRERIRAKAVARGIIAADQALAPTDIDELIFAPGLSTTEQANELSGRGVGMDVVRRNVEALHGRIEIETRPGEGTRFTLRLPLTLAVTDGMLVRVGEERYIVPTFSIVTSFRPQPGALTTEARGGELVMLHGRPVPIVRLHHAFDVAGAETDPAAALLVVIAEAQERYALLVDELLGQQQFVAKPVTGGLGSVEGVAGAAILGDGRVGLILDPAGLVAAARRRPAWGVRARLRLA